VSDVKRPSIVTYAHRYKPPPRKKQAAPLPGRAVVTKRARPNTGAPKTGPTAVTAPPPANETMTGSRHLQSPRSSPRPAGSS
jgi:hypothetical protein